MSCARGASVVCSTCSRVVALSVTLLVSIDSDRWLLGSRLSADLRLFFLTHAHDLLLEELHLVKVTVTNLVLLPLFVLAALLAALAVHAVARDVLQGLKLVVEVHFSVLLVATADWLVRVALTHGKQVEVFKAGAIHEVLAHGVGNGC